MSELIWERMFFVVTKIPIEDEEKAKKIAASVGYDMVHVKKPNVLGIFLIVKKAIPSRKDAPPFIFNGPNVRTLVEKAQFKNTAL